MGSHSAGFSVQTARGAAFRRDTHILDPHARCAASIPTSARRGMHNASSSMTHDQEALQGTNICSHQRLQEPVIHRREPMRAHQHHVRARQTLSGTAGRSR